MHFWGDGGDSPCAAEPVSAQTGPSGGWDYFLSLAKSGKAACDLLQLEKIVWRGLAVPTPSRNTPVAVPGRLSEKRGTKKKTNLTNVQLSLRKGTLELSSGSLSCPSTPSWRGSGRNSKEGNKARGSH